MSSIPTKVPPMSRNSTVQEFSMPQHWRSGWMTLEPRDLLLDEITRPELPIYLKCGFGDRQAPLGASGQLVERLMMLLRTRVDSAEHSSPDWDSIDFGARPIRKRNLKGRVRQVERPVLVGEVETERE